LVPPLQGFGATAVIVTENLEVCVLLKKPTNGFLVFRKPFDDVEQACPNNRHTIPDF
jgi:hypothetical protein